MIAISESSANLSQLRLFAKSVIAQKTLTKDDLRAILCRSLLAEVVSVQEQQKSESEYFQYAESIIPQRQESFLDDADNSGVPMSDDLEFFRVIEKLSRRETRADGIRELCTYDDRYPAERIIDTIIRLTPSLRRDIEAFRMPRSGRPSSRSSYKASGSVSGSRPSSRSSQRRPSSRSMQSRL